MPNANDSKKNVSAKLKLSELSDGNLHNWLEKRWEESGTVFDELTQRYETNKKIWANNPEWLDSLLKKDEKVTTSRLFMDHEHLLSFLLARPSQPHVIAPSDSDEDRLYALDVQDYMYEYQSRDEILQAVKRALRRMFMSRLFSLKVCWNRLTDDFSVRDVDPRKIRFRTGVQSEEEMDFIREEITEPAATFLMRFDHDSAAQGLILTAMGKGYDDIASLWENDEDVTYFESWISWGDEHLLVHEVNGQVVNRKNNEYYDFEPPLVNPEAAANYRKATGPDRRRDTFGEARGDLAVDGKEGKSLRRGMWEHPRKPYIFGTVYDLEGELLGATDLFDQARPLQRSADTRKKDIGDNARLVNGIWLIDSETTQLTKAQASQVKAVTEGYVWCKNATTGIRRETGAPLPGFVMEDLKQTLELIDEITGATSTFRGSREGQETAEGRQILREQSEGRLNETIKLVDRVYRDIFNWHLHFIQLRYTEQRNATLTKVDRPRNISLHGDSIVPGTRVEVVPGQSLPKDRVTRSLKAESAFKNEVITPMRYLEEQGWENPERLVKDTMLFRANPMAALNFTPEEIAQLQQAQMQQAGEEQAGMEAERATQLQQAQEMLESPEFKAKSEVEKARIVDQLTQQFPELGET